MVNVLCAENMGQELERARIVGWRQAQRIKHTHVSPVCVMDKAYEVCFHRRVSCPS
jgi:hypothetical protein